MIEKLIFGWLINFWSIQVYFSSLFVVSIPIFVHISSRVSSDFWLSAAISIFDVASSSPTLCQYYRLPVSFPFKLGFIDSLWNSHLVKAYFLLSTSHSVRGKTIEIKKLLEKYFCSRFNGFFVNVIETNMKTYFRGDKNRGIKLPKANFLEQTDWYLSSCVLLHETMKVIKWKCVSSFRL